MARWFGIGVVVLWLTAMSVVFYHDVWPHWMAGAPPVQMPDPNAGESLRRFQNGIFSRLGRVGTSWVHFYDRIGNPLIYSETVLDRLALLPPILVKSELTYAEDGRLDTIKLEILGAPMRLEFSGENYGMDFSCELRTGPGPDDRYGFKLDASAAATMSDALRPFTLLKDLHVGQTWRMRLVNPLPALRGGRARVESYLARVTARETIEHRDRNVECFRIESHNVRAWADQAGRVLVQEVDLPIFGTLTIRQEPYDEHARSQTVTRGGVFLLNPQKSEEPPAATTRRAGTE